MSRDRKLMKGLTHRIGTITHASLSDDLFASAPAKIRNVASVASYNWLDDTAPTIVIPGGAPIWTDRTLPFEPAPFEGQTFIDNAQRSERFSQPILSAGASLARKLLRWISGKSFKAVRIGAEVAGADEGTLLLTRWEPWTGAGHANSQGWGHAFEQAMTVPAPGCEGTTAHHQIISYDLGKLKLMVRFEVDAQLTGDDQGAVGIGSRTMTGKRPMGGKPTIFPESSSLHYIRSSSTALTPVESLIEIKTRSLGKAFDMKDTFAQLLLAQTHHLHVAKHDKGEFISLERFALEQEPLKSRGEELEEDLGKLVSLLSRMRVIAAEASERDKGVTFVFRGGGAQCDAWEVGKPKARNALSPDLLARFGGRGRGKVGSLIK